MFKIKFTQDSEISGHPVKKDEEVYVSRSIRDAKVAAKVAIEVEANVATKINKLKKDK